MGRVYNQPLKDNDGNIFLILTKKLKNATAGHNLKLIQISKYLQKNVSNDSSNGNGSSGSSSGSSNNNNNISINSNNSNSNSNNANNSGINSGIVNSNSTTFNINNSTINSNYVDIIAKNLKVCFFFELVFYLFLYNTKYFFRQ